MPRLRGAEKAQIRLRVRKDLADKATSLGAHWLELAIEAYPTIGIWPPWSDGAKPDVRLPDLKKPPYAAPPEKSRTAAPSIGPQRAAPGSRLKKAKGA